jgi:hypothetical protein
MVISFCSLLTILDGKEGEKERLERSGKQKYVSALSIAQLSGKKKYCIRD